jgi:hypothetical protein
MGRLRPPLLFAVNCYPIGRASQPNGGYHFVGIVGEVAYDVLRRTKRGRPKMTKTQAAKIRTAAATLEMLQTVNAPLENQDSASRIVTRLRRQLRRVR